MQPTSGTNKCVVVVDVRQMLRKSQLLYTGCSCVGAGGFSHPMGLKLAGSAYPEFL